MTIKKLANRSVSIRSATYDELAAYAKTSLPGFTRVSEAVQQLLSDRSAILDTLNKSLTSDEKVVQIKLRLEPDDA